MFKIDIVATGSRGNSILINDVLMIDTGIRQKDFKNYCDDVKFIFLTHRHTDHTNIKLLQYIYKNRPLLLKNGLYANQDTFDYIRDKDPELADFAYSKDRLIQKDSKFVLQDPKNKDIYFIEAFELVHDVENYGFVIKNRHNENLLFGTDTASMDYAPKDKYDYILLEGNYHAQEVIAMLESEDDDEVLRALRNLRHLSVQSFENFVRKHSKENAEVYQLHESFEFGLRSPLSEDYVPLRDMDS